MATRKLTLIQAAEHFGISKEAIHNRVRRGSLEVVIEDGIKMVLIDVQSTPVKKAPRARAKRVTPKVAQTNSDDKYYKMLEEQNAKLQSRVDMLEGETKNLRDQKEQMLIEQKEKIEQIYKEKDEQMKQFFANIATQFALGAPKSEPVVEKQREEVIEVTEIKKPKVIKEKIDVKKLTPVKKFIKEYAKRQKCSLEKVDRIKKRFKKYAKKDKRIIVVDGKSYVNPKKYDYSNLMKW